MIAMEIPYELFAKLSIASLAEFGAAFEKFRDNAFRLECLPSYLVEEEAEYLSAYRRGMDCPVGMNNEWLQFLTNAQSMKRIIQRVRLVPEQRQVLDYFGFEAEWGYKKNILAGEKIKLLPNCNLLGYAKKTPILQDFWLFDDVECYVIFYDLIGRFLGTMRVPDSEVVFYVHLSKRLWDDAYEFDREKGYIWK